jgi:fatty acid desaturase
MQHEVFRSAAHGTAADPRLREVRWRDLVATRPLEAVRELSISVPWLLGALVASHLALTHHPLWILGSLIASFYFFLTGLRQVHNAHHYALGLSKGATEWVMFVLSIAMMSSMHAIQVTHLHHHKHCLDDQDVEASTAHLPWYRAILAGPSFITSLHVHGLRLAKRRQRRWILAELATLTVWTPLVLSVLDLPALQIHLALMLVGQCLTGFFAVWTVHHGCEATTTVARTQRGLLKNFVSYEMFFHLEHHLFPAVPTRRLPELARRLDEAAPEVRRKMVF